MRDRSPGLAFVLELVFGLFGFLGIGRFYVGNVLLGLLLLFGWWVFLGVEIALMFVGIGYCLLPLNILVPIFSAILARNAARR